jgi:hypothetical protein
MLICIYCNGKDQNGCISAWVPCSPDLVQRRFVVLEAVRLIDHEVRPLHLPQHLQEQHRHVVQAIATGCIMQAREVMQSAEGGLPKCQPLTPGGRQEGTLARIQKTDLGVLQHQLVGCDERLKLVRAQAAVSWRELKVANDLWKASHR